MLIAATVISFLLTAHFLLRFYEACVYGQPAARWGWGGLALAILSIGLAGALIYAHA